MKWTKDDRCRYPVIETAETLHGEAKGTHCGLQIDQIRDRYSWLEWRVTDGWNHDSSGRYVAYDVTVRILALNALEAARALVAVRTHIEENDDVSHAQKDNT